MRILKAIETKYLALPLARKLALSFMAVILVMALVITVSINAALNIYEEKLNEGLQNQLEVFSSEIEKAMNDYDRISSIMFMDGSIQVMLSQLNETENAFQKAELVQEIREVLSERSYDYEYILNMMYVSKDGLLITAQETKSEMSEERFAYVRQTFEEAKGDFILVLTDDENHVLQGGRRIYRRIDGKSVELGDFILDIDLKGIIESVMYTSSVSPSALIVSSKETVLYESDPSLREALGILDANYCVKTIQGEKYFVSRAISPIKNWIFVSMMPYADVVGKTNKIREAVWLVIILISACSMLLARAIARAVTQPLGQLLYSMRIVEKGRFHEAQDHTSEPASLDEVSALAREFSNMLEAIDHLIIENYEKQLLLQKTRYKMLQAQINPHFLYNTLSTVKWLIRMDRKEEAMKVVNGLSDVLRSALSKKDYSNAAEELKILKHYIDIQEIRFGKRIQFSINAEGKLENYLLPHFTLQPLVENAIMHGADEKEDICRIKISLTERGEHLEITVADDGMGMTKEHLEKVRSFTVKPQGHGIGIKNIYDRLSILYRDFAFQIESELGKGTVVSIRIPETSLVPEELEEEKENGGQAE